MDGELEEWWEDIQIDKKVSRWASNLFLAKNEKCVNWFMDSSWLLWYARLYTSFYYSYVYSYEEQYFQNMISQTQNQNYHSQVMCQEKKRVWGWQDVTNF